MYSIKHMKTRDAKIIKIIELASKSGVVRRAEVRSHGIHHEYLRQLCQQDELVRIGQVRVHVHTIEGVKV